jgi:hypothetical protein
MRYFTLFTNKNKPKYIQKIEKTSEVTVIKKSIFFKQKKNRPLAVYYQSSTSLQSLKNIKNMIFG